MRRKFAFIGAAAASLLLAAAPVHAQRSPRIALDILQQQLGITSGLNVVESDTSVSGSPIKVLNADPSRVWVLLVNDATSNCLWQHNAGVNLAVGNFLNANGGFVEVDVRTDFLEPTREFWVVCGIVGSNVHATEVKLNQ